MSFLLQDDDEDDQQATLAVALAFIDSCDESSSDSRDSSSASGTSSSESRSTDNEENQNDQEPEADKRASLRVVIRTTANKKLTAAAAAITATTGLEPVKQKQAEPEARAQQVASVPAAAVAGIARDHAARNSSAVTRHRARKRAEFALLRAQLVELESMLAHLQRVKSTRDASAASRPNHNPSSNRGTSNVMALSQASTLTTEAQTDKSLWMEIMATQAKERFKSEELNQKLKDAVAKQKKISKALEAVLGIKGETSAPMQYGFDLLSDIQKQTLYNDSMLSMESMTLAGLQASVAQMYQTINTVFDNATIAASATNGLDMVSHSTQVKKDPETGDQYIELRTTTALPFGFLEAAQLIRQVFAMMRPQNYPGCSIQKRDITDSSFEKSYTFMLDNPSGGAVELRGVSFVQGFVHERHVAYVFASVATTPNGLVFREKGWVALYRSSDDNLPFSSVMQSCLQVSNEPCASSSSRSKQPSVDLDSATRENVLREFVLAALVSRTRYQYQTIQNVMLESAQYVQAERDPAPALLALNC